MVGIIGKPFTTVENQVEILGRRGVICDAGTPKTLLREGYYAIVNGYKAPFLDAEASRAANEDRYLEGTRFDDIYALFRFDRDLRAIAFRFLMMVESTLRSLISYCFCTAHPGTEDYLKPACFTRASGYLRDGRDFERDLAWMIDTFEKHAHGMVVDTTGSPAPSDVRVQYYRDVHGGVPLWVLFTELTFGNLKYFYALMRRDEQKAVCERVRETCGRMRSLTPQEMIDDLDILVDARNICAHEERLWSARVGASGEAGFSEIVATIKNYLTDDGDLALDEMLAKLAEDYGRQGPALGEVISKLGIWRGGGTRPETACTSGRCHVDLR